MSSVINCPRCGGAMDNSEMLVGMVECAHCGYPFTILPPVPARVGASGAAPPQIAASPTFDGPAQSTTGALTPQHGQHWTPITPQQPVVIFHATTAAPAYIPDKKSAGLAAVLSFFYAGLGQIYNGEIFKGLIMMFVLPLGVAIWYFFGGMVAIALRNPGAFLAVVILAVGAIIGIWIWAMVDAHSTAERINYENRRRHGGGGRL